MAINITYEAQLEYELARHRFLHQHSEYIYTYSNSVSVNSKELSREKVEEIVNSHFKIEKTYHLTINNENLYSWLIEASLLGRPFVKCLILIVQHPDCINFSVDATKETDAREAHAFLKKGFKSFMVKKDEHHVPVRFWYNAGTYNESYVRQIKCPSFADIEANYPSHTLDELRWLIETNNPWEIGKLLFWMGNAGTGKTFATRALIREWAPKMSPHVIVDPEKFFASTPYLMEVLQHVGEEDKKSGNLIILEDSPRVVLAEARASHETYNMSRFLNITDGILGQGVSSIFLLTTNDEIEDIDPAFLRNGRLLQRMKFGPLSVEQANKWLEVHKYKGEPVEDETALSDLYAKVTGRAAHAQEIEKTRAGFL